MHTFTRLRPLFSMTGLLLALAIALPAQAQRLCEAIVADALETAAENCSDFAGDNACYGYDALTATFHADTIEDDLGTEDLLIPLPVIHTLDGSGFDAESDEWGLGYVQLGTELGAFNEGEAVRLIMMGDVTLENTVTPDDENNVPFAVMYMLANQNTACPEAVNNLVIQSPEGTEGKITINEVPVYFGSTIVLGFGEDAGDDVMYLTVLDGYAVVDPNTPRELTITTREYSVVPSVESEPIDDLLVGGSALDTNGEPLTRPIVADNFSLPEPLTEDGEGFRSLEYYRTIEAIPDSLLNYAIDLEVEIQPCACEEEGFVPSETFSGSKSGGN
jgi:hypothetical protein